MRPRLAAALRTISALALAAALPASAATAPRAHRAVAGEQDCAACHRTATPEAFAAWEGSPHGVALVKCVVCHGSTGKDFRARPAATSCRGCHAAQVEALAQRTPQDCFACHAPHSLASNPHTRR